MKFHSSLQNEALQLCIKINAVIDRVEYMFTSDFEAEVEDCESTTLHHYYREAMIQGYNFAFEVSVQGLEPCLLSMGLSMTPPTMLECSEI